VVDTAVASPSAAEPTAHRVRLRLVGLSFLMLFAELALIRWLGSHVVYLSYFSNFVLLGSFLGIGIGFLRAHGKSDLFRYAPVALALLIAFVRIFPVEIDRSGATLIFFGSFSRTGLPPWMTLPVIFVAVALVMAMIAEGVARTFVLFEPLEAYRLDIIGSILGIASFMVLAFLHAPPIAWGAVAAALFVVLLSAGLRPLQVIAVLGLVVMLGSESLMAGESWSPYYRVSARRLADGQVDVNVNGIPHQRIAPLSHIREEAPLYLAPYELTGTAPGGVLIVGAGTGNDVAVALAEGVDDVDAVEIDPRLHELGVELHPDRPYADPRVRVTIDDGRAFLERTARRYDLIVFALPDSLTLVSGQAQLRLESYLFTIEAMQEARDHLDAGGVFVMYNYYREQWLIDRLASTLEVAFGHQPCVLAAGPGRLAMLAIGLDEDAIRCAAPSTGSGPAPATDDYPFLYLRARGIPGPYLVAVLAILAASLVAVRALGGPLREMRGYLDLFFMGSAFLLLETKSVVGFALLFGTTWLVNALVFAGILLSVLAAVELSRRLRVSRPQLLYAALFVALGVAWAVPPSFLLALSVLPRFAVAVVLAFAPIFLANLVFAQRFRDVESSGVAFAANLLGAMLGGVLEYGSLLVGYRGLVLIAAGLYAVALAASRRTPALVGP